MIARISIPLARESAVNVWLLRGDPLTLIDTGPVSAAALAALESGLAEHGVRVEDLELVLVTHHHPDHSGLAATIRRRSGASVAVHEELGAYLEHFAERVANEKIFFRSLLAEHGVPERLLGEETGYWQWLDASFEDCVPDVRLREHEIVHAGGRELRVLHRVGHSVTDTLFVDEHDGSAFVGDHLLTTPAYAELGPADDGARTRALVRYFANLRRLDEQEIGTLYTGHGDEILDHHAAIAARLQAADDRCARIGELLHEGPLTAFELAERLWSSRRVERDPVLAVSDVVGHLDLLVERGAVEEELNGSSLRHALLPI